MGPRMMKAKTQKRDISAEVVALEEPEKMSEPGEKSGENQREQEEGVARFWRREAPRIA